LDDLPSIQQSDEGICMSQMEYGSSPFERHGMHDCNPIQTPMNTNQKFSLNFEEAKVDARIYQSLIGSDLFERLYGAKRRVLRYMKKGTCSYSLRYTVNNYELCDFSDSNWVGLLDDCRSTIGCAFSLSSGKIVWSSKKQSFIVLLFAEAEYIAVISTTCEVVIWLRRILEDMKQHQ
jgi:hypothetical protein